jgi:hypothetical protein
MGDYLTDYIGFIWRYVVHDPAPVLGAVPAGIPATLAALWRLCDLPEVRQYFNIVGLGTLGSAHLGDEARGLLAQRRLLRRAGDRGVGTAAIPKIAILKPAVHLAVMLWLVSLGISVAVFIGNGETSLGATRTCRRFRRTLHGRCWCSPCSASCRSWPDAS